MAGSYRARFNTSSFVY